MFIGYRDGGERGEGGGVVLAHGPTCGLWCMQPLPKREVQTTGSDYSRTHLMGRVHRLQNGPCQAAKIRLHPVV